MGEKIELINKDCLEAMAAMENDSIHSIVTDPPYGLSFMGKGWDHGVPGVPYWKEAFRVLKPGGFLLAFGGTRTFHRLAVAIEDAGFEIRDCLSWMYGSGFPKSMDVGMNIDKEAGVERTQRTGVKPWMHDPEHVEKTHHDYAPATSEAQQWDGWGTALKPAWEPIIMARKPLSKKTVAKNVLKHGTGSINVDGTRIGTNPGYRYDASKNGTTFHGEQGSRPLQTKEERGKDIVESTKGRWPANVLLTHHEDCVQVGVTSEMVGGGEKMSQTGNAAVEFGGGYESGDGFVGREVQVPVYECHQDCPVRLLDDQTSARSMRGDGIGSGYHGSEASYDTMRGYTDSGGGSRFFYCGKVSKDERNAGLPRGTVNTHPTMKPVALMRWLVKLVTPPGGTCCDPFMGSGSTGVACVQEEFDFIGIDNDQTGYFETAKLRVGYAINTTTPRMF